METVTVTVVGSVPPGETEGTTRERKISRVRRMSDALTNIMTLEHVRVAAAAQNQQGETEGTTRERKISRVRRLSDVLTNIAPLDHVRIATAAQHQPEETDVTTRERKISRTRKISDALTNVVTLNHYPWNAHSGFETLTSQHSPSLADLVKSEQSPDTLSLHSRKSSIDFTGIHVLDGEGGRGHPDRKLSVIGDGHKLGKHPGGHPGTRWPQLIASIAANVGAFGFGTVLAWSATGIASMNETDDLGELTTTISSWIGSIPTLGAVFSTPFGSFALDALGRRKSMLYLTIPFIVGWLFIGLAQNFFMVLFGRFLTGFCGGCLSIILPIFTAETADATVRGGLGSLFDLMMSTGMLYIYVVGVFLPWRYQAFACAAIPVAFFVLMFFVPESPRYLVQREKEQKAEKAIYWLKGSKVHPYRFYKEISDIKTSVGETKGSDATFLESFDRALLMPTTILIGIMFFTTLTGVDAIMAYTVTIFESAGSTMDPKLSTIIIGIVTMVASFPTAAIVDIAGRRILLMASELVMAVSLGVMGLYFYMMRTETVLFGVISYDAITWVPLASLVLFIIGYSLGCGPLSMMMIGELLPNKLKAVLSL